MPKQLAGKSLSAMFSLIRQEIREGRFQRSMVIVTAFSAIVSGYEAYAQHLRGAFANWLMWTPVWLTVPTLVTATIALWSQRVARRLLPVISLVSLMDGVIGFGFHLRGIKRMPGGFKIGQYNVVMGPPIFAPLLICTVGVLGLLASLLRREQLPSPVLGKSAPTVKPRDRNKAAKNDALHELAADVSHGRFQQGMALASASFAVLSGGEAYFEHLRGSFNQRLMWTPVWVTPAAVAAGIGAARSPQVAKRVLPGISVIAFLEGLLGFFLHLRGIRRMPGGFGNFQFNATLGPPLFAPLLFSAVGLLGIIASLLRRRNH